MDKQMLKIPDLDDAKGPFWVRRAARRATPAPFDSAVEALLKVTDRWTRPAHTTTPGLGADENHDGQAEPGSVTTCEGDDQRGHEHQ